jgi:hypothetical protein
VWRQFDPFCGIDFVLRFNHPGESVPGQNLADSNILRAFAHI